MPTRQAIFNRSERKRRAQEGRCVQCGNRRPPGASRCKRCNQNNRESNKLAKRRSRVRLANL